MNKKTIGIIALIALAGAALAAVIVRLPSAGRADSGDAPAETADYPRGPHGARLLTGSDGLQLEMTMYETGVPPQLRIYPYDSEMKPIPPSEVSLDVELHRLGGRIDRITFTPEADYLRGNETIEEPHSFEVKIAARRDGRGYQWAYSQVEGKVRMGPEQIKSSGIVIAVAGPRVVQATFELPGEVKADATRETHVVPRVEGVVVQVLKQEGDPVRRGDLLVVMNSRELADAKSAYLQSIRRAEFARATLDREESLWKRKISAEREYLQAKKDADEARLAVDLAAQRLVALGVPEGSLSRIALEPRQTLPRFEVRSPLDGTVVMRNVAAGETVRADEEIFTVADLSSVWVDVNVYARDLRSVRIGQEAVVLSRDLGIDAPGRIHYIGPLVGEETRSATARLRLPNPARLWRPGLFVTVRLVREQAQVPVAVSADAIQSFRDWQVVFVKYGDWFEARPLELGRSDGRWVEIVSGLRAGEEYAAANSFAVKAEIGKLGASHDH